MAKKTRCSDIKIKVECPNCKITTSIQLYTAIKRWFDESNSGYCAECKRYTSQIGMFARSARANAKGKLLCSVCGRTTICSYMYEFSIKKAIKKGEMSAFVCPVCGLAERAKNPQQTKEKSIIKNSTTIKSKIIINLFGCKIWPAGDQDSFISPRCKWANNCKHYNDCMAYIAHHYIDWYGFAADGKGFEKRYF